MKSIIIITLISILVLSTLTEAKRPKSGHAKRKPHPRRTNSIQGEGLVKDLKSQNSSWHAELNHRFKNRNVDEILKSLGVADDHDDIVDEYEAKHPVANDVYGYSNTAIPSSFDSRTQWPQCNKTIARIADQSKCGSCWAVSSAGAFSDRMCIATNGSKVVNLSADDLLTCCNGCGVGCTGGYPFKAFNYIKQYGVVSGGDYNDNSTCMPYPFPPCSGSAASSYSQCVGFGGDFNAPQCTSQCQQSYRRQYTQDKRFALTPLSFRQNPQAMQQEIMTNGPIVFAAMEVYEDFLYYRGGVYQHMSGGYIGLHAVRVIGWGTQNNLPYWIVANSWGSQWGENGFFRILRGYNHCNIESTANAATVDVQRSG
ncbi:unnamed protein product [Bursaphelenchus okinawaensis]|uniref:Peptidase C1A papain C-terminal domain-containing protein n=1 Tax=Bursaphelenchus okinawaensis TaxID=465554 RepID=A0A811KG72_9BILA|nr:unnamed protein product [Bursaphelenchus okinawaensis]CAG9101652.1 unnamed protein product [Bursaphelenchus okinawaensis]